jgi:YD repeat-containing protein
VPTPEYDGHGRLWRRTTPEQGATTYSYNRDDTMQVTTDARGVTTAFLYNNRHQVKNINYSVPANSEVTATGNVSFSYDAAGNRTAMSNGTELRQYAYDGLSRLTHEDINLPGLDFNWRRKHRSNTGKGSGRVLFLVQCVALLMEWLLEIQPQQYLQQVSEHQ